MMCGICGCNSEDETIHHEHDNHSHHEIIRVEHDLLAKNNQFATANRHYFKKNKITAINIMSSPGSGKTTLLTRTLSELKDKLHMAVIVGDQQTDCDAEQLKTSGAQAIQINTGKGCHLDAHMVGHAVEDLSLHEPTILFIENVGNLVCPALFDLGETYKVVLLSVTEGENKPLKYPDIFRKADLMILTKTDLLPYVEFDTDQCIEYAMRVNPAINVLSLSATTGSGLGAWYKKISNTNT
jgi:hydrogenase nickel incorporation protein HypB